VSKESAVALSVLLLVAAAAIVGGMRSWREDPVR
jgi:molybdate transport system permease protein